MTLAIGVNALNLTNTTSQLTTAQASLEEAISALNNGNIQLAELKAAEVLSIEPSNDLALLIYGITLCHRSEAVHGLEYIAKAVELNPVSATNRYNYAVTLSQVGQDNAAMLQYQTMLRWSPNHADALWNYGELLRLRGFFQEALNCFEKIIALNGYYPALYHRMAVCYGALDLDTQAEKFFETELAERNDALTHWEYSHFLLSRERFAAGWEHYNYRFVCGQKISVYCTDFPYPLWQGQFLPNSTLLIHGEQGLGDEIMFASIVPELMKEAETVNAKIILACRPTLVRLFQHSFPAVTVIPHEVGGREADLSTLGTIDAQCPIGNLPYWRRKTAAEFGTPKAYLEAPTTETDAFQKKLEALGFYHNDDPAWPHLSVGLAWGSNPLVKTMSGLQRNLPIRELAGLSGIAGVRYVGLQNKERAFELADAPELDCFDVSAALTDFATTAGLIANLDLVITVCTSLAHVAAAMGKETWVLVQHHAEWRWGQRDKDSLWYPNIRVFRQASKGDWQGVIRKVRLELNRRLLENPMKMAK